MEIGSLILGIINLILLIVVLLVSRKPMKADSNAELLQEVTAQFKDEIKKEAVTTRESTAMSLGLQNSNLQALLSIQREGLDKGLANTNEKFDILTKAMSEALSEIRAELKGGAQEMRESNEKQLEKMRATVDEKLSENLEQRFQKSFGIVAERLDAITKGFGEMQNLTSGMTDLKRVLSNVKTRGTWGEASLDYMLSQILTPDQYDKSVAISRSENADRVDFVVNLPGKSSEKVWLPIDAKFPIEDYQRLLDATDETAVALAKRALAVRLRTEAISIKNKYIKPPKTTDFAILYLPIEGLFAEAVQIRGLCDELQNKHRIVLCGPTTLAALLNSLQMGFRSVAIEKRSSEIYKLLGAFRSDFDTFCSIIEKTQKKLGEVTTEINRASDRTRKIQTRLDKVQIDTVDREELEEGIASDEI